MRKRNFTLVEIMIVVAIIGLLAAIAIPNFVRSREAARQKTCIQNLRAIDYAKETWAMENNKGNTDAVDATAEAAIADYIKGGTMPTCPAGGTYAVGAIGTDPTCDYTSTDYPHELPNTP